MDEEVFVELENTLTLLRRATHALDAAMVAVLGAGTGGTGGGRRKARRAVVAAADLGDRLINLAKKHSLTVDPPGVAAIGSQADAIAFAKVGGWVMLLFGRVGGWMRAGMVGGVGPGGGGGWCA